MKRLFSTSDVHPRDRFAYWNEVACKTLVERDSVPEDRRRFNAEIQIGRIDDIGVVLCATSAMRIAHTARHAARANDADLMICRQLAGTLAIEQGGRETVMEAGDFMLLDPRIPYTGIYPNDSKVLIFKVARRQIEARIGDVRKSSARVVKGSDGKNVLTCEFLGTLYNHCEKLEASVAGIVKEYMLDLVAASVAKMVDGEGHRTSAAQTLTLVNVHAAIDARLSDPLLDAKAVAAAAGVTVRYANTVLALQDTSIMRLVQARRLERCRKALADPSQAHRTVSEIAYGWGFSDMTHFGRRFRATYGLLPSEYRQRAKRAAAMTC